MDKFWEFDLQFVDDKLGPVGVLGHMYELGTTAYGPAEWAVICIGHPINPALTWYLPEAEMDAFVERNHERLQNAVNSAADSVVSSFNEVDW